MIVSLLKVSAQIQKHSITDLLILRCRYNLFQFYSKEQVGISVSNLNFACESSAQMGYIAKFNRLQTGKQ